MGGIACIDEEATGVSQGLADIVSVLGQQASDWTVAAPRPAPAVPLAAGSQASPQRADSQRRLLAVAALAFLDTVARVLREVLHGTPDWEDVARVEGFGNTLGAERLMLTTQDESGNVLLSAHTAARYADLTAGDIPTVA